MAKIIGNTTATPNPRPDWNQTDETKADYIKNKPNVVTQEVDPTVPAWAKEPTKPTYTAEEVGALPEDTTLAEMPDDVDHRTVSDNEKTTWNEKFDKAGGTITGNVAITGDLTVNGTTFSEDHETIVVEDNMMVLNSNKVDLQTAVSGIAMNKNADSTYGAVYDPVDDTFKFGEGTLNEANEFEFNDGEGLPFAVRNDSSEFTDGHIVEWSADGNKLVDSGKSVEDFSPVGHGHVIDDVAELQETLDAKVLLGTESINTDVAYIKEVPSTAAKYATITKIGGMTKKCTNLLNLNTLVVTGNNTYTKDAEAGRVTVKFTGVHSPLRWRVQVPKNTTLTLGFDSYSGANATVQISDTLQIPSGSAETIDGKISLATGKKSVSVNTGKYEELTVSVYIPAGSDFDVDIVGLRVNENDSLLPFEPYYEGLRDAKVTAIKSVGANMVKQPYSFGSQTIQGVTITVNSDNSITFNGTATGDIALNMGQVYLRKDVSYTINGLKNFTEAQALFYVKTGRFFDKLLINSNGAVTKTCLKDGVATLELYIYRGTTINQTVYPMLNEGTEALPYSPYTEYTIAIPESVQSLEGYGLGINKDYNNHIDFEGKKFNRVVGKVDLNTLIWGYSEADKRFYTTAIPFKTVANNIKPNLICANYTGVNFNDFYSKPDVDKTISVTGQYLFIRDLSYTDVSTFVSTLKGVSLVYALATPTTEDISDLITDDNLIGVEGGGTLTFENEYGYDVPSEVKFRLNNNDKVSAKTFVGDLIGTSSRTISDEDGRSLKNNYASTGTNEIVESDTLFVDIPNDEQLANNVKISKIGGMTRKCTNMLPYPYIGNSNTYRDVVWKVNTDGTVVANGTANGGNSILDLHNPISLPQGDYYIYANDGNKLPLGCVIVVYKNGSYIGEANGVFSFSVTSNDKLRIYLQVVNGVTVNNAIFKPMIAKSIIPYEPYFEGLRHAKVTAVKSVGINIWDEQWEIGFIQTGNGQNANSDVRIRSKNHFRCLPNTQYYISGITDGDIIMYEYGADKSFIRVTYLYKNKFTTAENTRYLRLVLNESYGTTYKNNICVNVSNTEHNGKYYSYTEHTIPIPENIQNLEGYGLGINDTLYNYIDFESKKFNRAVGKVDLATLVWTLELNEGNSYWYTKSILDIKYVNANTEVGVGLWENGIIRMGSGMYLSVKGELAIDVSRISCNNGSSTEKPTGILVYALATPTIEDIAIANIVGVEGGGTIEFVNEYNYDINSTLEFYYGKKDRIHIDEVVGNLKGTATYAELSEYSKKAAHTEIADQATKAVQDGNGNVIVDTYLSKNNLGFTTNVNTKNYKVQADANNNLYVNVPWEGGGEGADGNYYHIPDHPSGLRLADGVGISPMYVPFANSSNNQQGVVATGGDVTINNGVITVNDDSHNHTIANVDNLQSTLDYKLDSLSDMTKFPVNYGFAIGRKGNTVGVSNGPDNYYLLLDSTNTLRTGIQLNGASDVRWQEISKVDHEHGYLPLTGGTIYSSNSTTDTPLRIRAKNTDSFVSFHNEAGTYLAGIGVRSDKKPYVYTSERGYEEILTTSGGTMTGEITIGQGDGNGIQLGKLGYINATNNDGSAKTCTILGVNASQGDALVGHPQFNLQLRGSGDAPMYNNKTIIHSGNIGEQSVAKAVRSWAMYVTDRRDETLTPDYFDDQQISTFFSNTDCPDGAWKSGITVKGWLNDYKSWQLFSNSDNNDSDNSLYFRSGRNTSWHPWRKIIDSSNIGSQNVLGAYLLNNFYSTRPATANLAVAGDGSVKTFKSTSSMTEGHPVAYGTSSTGNGEGHILHFEWDNAGGYSGQIFLGNGPADSMQYRVMNNKQWHPWVRLIDSNNIDSYALPLYGGTLTNSLILNNGGTGESPALIFRRGEFRDNTTDWRLFVNNGNLYFSFANAVNGWNDSVYIKDHTNIIVGNLEGNASYANSAGSVAWENVSDKPPICTISEVQALLDNFAATNILNAAY